MNRESAPRASPRIRTAAAVFARHPDLRGSAVRPPHAPPRTTGRGVAFMSGLDDADGLPPASLPGPRRARLPLPSAVVPGGPQHDGDITDGLEEAYWSVYDGAAAKATVRQLLARLPRIVRRIGRLAWNTDRPATLAVVLLQLASAAMTAFGLMASVAVLRELFAEGPTPDRVRAAVPQLLVVVGFLATRALLEAGVAVAQARVTPKIRAALETEFLTLTPTCGLEIVDDADWHDEGTAPTTADCSTRGRSSARSSPWPRPSSDWWAPRVSWRPPPRAAAAASCCPCCRSARRPSAAPGRASTPSSGGTRCSAGCGSFSWLLLERDAPRRTPLGHRPGRAAGGAPPADDTDRRGGHPARRELGEAVAGGSGGSAGSAPHHLHGARRHADRGLAAAGRRRGRGSWPFRPPRPR